MKPALPTIKRRLGLIAPAPLLWLLLLCGTWAFSTPAASAQINFAFSVGDGVNAYYLPMASSFVYAYDGFYYDWGGNGWLYSTDYIGPWYPLPPYSVLPLPLEYGPPPPMVPYHPYFVWWRAWVAPWYQVNHPAWWFRHRMDLDHYRVWRARVIPRYRGRLAVGRPFYRGSMHPVFRPGFGVVTRARRLPPARPFVRRPTVRGRVIYRPARPVSPAFRPLPRPAPLVRPAFHGPARPHAFRQVQPMRQASRQPIRR